MKIQVAVEKSGFMFEKIFVYEVPKELETKIYLGTRVFVPFGEKNSLRLGFVFRILDNLNLDLNLNNNNKYKKLKKINSVIDENFILDKNMFDLAVWISKYYLCTYYEAFSAVFPKYIKNKINFENFNNFNNNIKIFDIILSEYQNLVYEKMLDWYFNSDIYCALLYGITGSGKTNLFLKLAQKLVLQKKNIMILVPEISLVPQILLNIEKYFGKNSFACFHSGLTNKNREIEWWKIKKKLVNIVVGTRSAILTPFVPDLIIIDEEQESTYKSDKAPRFHAIEIAKFLCKKYNSKLLLSSATPSVKNFYYAKSGKIKLFELKKRYGNAVLPEVSIININKNFYNKNFILSTELINLINKNILNNKQVILLLDRRGVHTFARCLSCNLIITCKNCSTALSHHVINNQDFFLCHYCGFNKKVSKICPNCKKSEVILFGVGTQSLEQEINKIIPNAKCIRLDADNIKSKFMYKKIFTDFKNLKYNIMIGTRMVAKGLDFENVNLVGIICADQAFFGEGYKTYEKTFSLISQTVGRSGRHDSSGKALIQTFSSDYNYNNETRNIIEIAAKQDYDLFFEKEIEMRKILLYPPFADICTIGFVSTKEKNALNSCLFFFEALKFTAKFEFNNMPLKILSPVPAFYLKISNKFRFKIVIKCKINKKFREFLNKSLINYKNNNKLNNIEILKKYKNNVHIFFDINSEEIF